MYANFIFCLLQDIHTQITLRECYYEIGNLLLVFVVFVNVVVNILLKVHNIPADGYFQIPAK